MGRAGITYTEVARAANELIEAGQTPTIERIRGHIGSGSYTTIAAYLKKWKAEHPTDQLAKTEGIPPALITTIKEIWTQLTKETNQRSQEIQATADEQIQSERNLRIDAENSAQQHKQAYQDIKDQFTQLTEQHDKLQDQLQKQVQTIKERDVKINHLNDTINTHQSENKQLHDLIDKLHKNLEHFQNTTAKQRQQEQLIFHEERTKLELHEKEVQKLQREITDCNNHINDTQQEYQTNLALLKREKDLSTSLQKHNDQLINSNSRLVTKIENLSHTKQKKKGKITQGS